MNHLSRSVPESAQTMGKEQTPFFDFTSEDFPVALLLGGKGLSGAGWNEKQNVVPGTVFDQRGQQVSGPQTNIAGDMNVQGDWVGGDKIEQNVNGDGNVFSGSGDVRVNYGLKHKE